MHRKDIFYQLVAGLAQIAIASTAVFFWYSASGIRIMWFFAGAALWAIAVLLKIYCARMVNRHAVGFLKKHLPYPLMIGFGGGFLGVQSSLFEMGLTLLGVLIWPSLAYGAQRAIAVGIGAGALEAFLLGMSVVIANAATLSGRWIPPESQRDKLSKNVSMTSCNWLLAPVERIIALLCHVSCRTLILLGVAHSIYSMIFWGFVLFALLDGVAGAAHISGKIESISLWWIELALTPFAILSLPIIVWCYEKFAI